MLNGNSWRFVKNWYETGSPGLVNIESRVRDAADVSKLGVFNFLEKLEGFRDSRVMESWNPSRIPDGPVPYKPGLSSVFQRKINFF